MIKNYSRFLLGLLIGLILGFFIAKAYLLKLSSPETHPSGPTIVTEAPAPSVSTKPIPPVLKNPSASNANIPKSVLNVLGYVGGRVFSNRERILPQRDAQHNPIQYQEWDVNPKVQGQNRDAERIVTGSDGRNWYSNDHYKSFKEIK